jgi:hypothetical protein
MSEEKCGLIVGKFNDAIGEAVNSALEGGVPPSDIARRLAKEIAGLMNVVDAREEWNEEVSARNTECSHN